MRKNILRIVAATTIVAVVATGVTVYAVSPSAEVKASFAPLKVASTKQTSNSVTIKWAKVKGAEKYVVYGKQGTKEACGKASKVKKLATYNSNITSKTFTKVAGKSVKKATWYRFYVKALDKNGETIAISKSVHVVTNGGKYTNNKVTVNKSVLTKAKNLKVGNTLNVNAKVKGIGKGKAPGTSHGKELNYESSNKEIATVSSNGKITANKTGTCYVYAYTVDGRYVAVKVVVTEEAPTTVAVTALQA